MMSKESQVPMTTGATALSPQDEPAVIKDFVRNSKGIEKHWVNYTPDGYVLTLLLPFSMSLVDAAAVIVSIVRGCTLCSWVGCEQRLVSRVFLETFAPLQKDSPYG
jgi:hypothetical protein